MGKRYGQWAGQPKGVPEDKTRCIQTVWPQSGSWADYQCRRKRGYGPDGLYCKQHAKIIASRNNQEVRSQ